MKKTRYVAVGTGGRIPMFIDPIVSRFREDAELVGLCDTSSIRRTFHQQRLMREYDAPLIPTYENFTQMMAEQRPDCVIVCTPDYLHHEHIIHSLELGADVISEKPLTIDGEKSLAIFQAVERTGRKVRTTFNLRWSPGVSKVREIIAKGDIGRVRHVDFEYALNTSHGADYFRRWHSQKESSGGLLVHKSTHHFDLINWWVDGIPSVVFAMGDLVFYGRTNAVERGHKNLTEYPRYTGFSAARKDPFRLTLDEDFTLTNLYYNAEAESGYIRDQNVFRDGITIEDSMSVLVKYRTGTMLTYSLNAYSPVEGFRATISGDEGRIDYQEQHESHIVTGDNAQNSGSYVMSLRVQRLFEEPQDISIPKAEGSHGGGDFLIQEQIFSAKPPTDSLGRNAGHEQGAASLLVGAAANESIATGLPVTIDKLLPLNPSATRLSELN